MSNNSRGATLAVIVLVLVLAASAGWYWFQKKTAAAEAADEEVELGKSEATVDPEEQAEGWFERQVDKVQDWVSRWGDDG